MDSSLLKKIIAIVVVALLVFSSFYKENFLISNEEQEELNKLSEKTNNRLSGKTIMALFYFIVTIITFLIGLWIYKK